MADGVIPYVKGHGTENDFVILPDLDARLDLGAALVAAICDRRAGLGADGVLRVVPAAGGFGPGVGWFMDYRNADGSVAETCGNGVRVFARYLVDTGLAEPGQLSIATRAGVVSASLGRSGDVTVDMGVPSLPDLGPVDVTVGSRTWAAAPVQVPNPHAVVFVTDLAEAGELAVPPKVTPADAYPHGVNVEFVVQRGPGHIALRVHERGVGETRSCGTGACAAAVATAVRSGWRPLGLGEARRPEGAAYAAYTVDVPGGRLAVAWRPDGHVELAGPAVLVAGGELRAEWVNSLRRPGGGGSSAVI
jgi:diaminopimelate epimerase